MHIIDTSDPSGHDAAAREKTRGVQIQEENRASTSSTDDEEEAAKSKEQREAELRDVGETEQHAEPEDLLSAECLVSSLGLSSSCSAVGTEENISGVCRLCDSIRLSIQSEKCLYFLEISNNHIA